MSGCRRDSPARGLHAETAGAQCVRWPGKPRPSTVRAYADRLVDQAVELAGVLADDLVGDLRREMAELVFDVFARVRPDAVGMRIIGTPHEGFDPQILDQFGADAVELESRAALTAPV